MSLKQSFCYPCFTSEGQSLAELCLEAKKIGFPAMELWHRNDQFDGLCKAAADAGLTIASMCGHRMVQNAGMNDPAHHDRIVEELTASIDVAVKAGIPNLITFSGNHIAGKTVEEGIQACIACLKRIAPIAEKHGINLNLELFNTKVNHPGYQADSTAYGVAVCKGVDSPRVKILYDIYHMQIMEGDVIRTIQDNIQHITHFHTAGNPGRHEIDDTQELNYKAICNAIRQTGFDGYLAHEFFPKGDKLKTLADAFERCSG